MKHDGEDPISDAIQAAEEVCDPLVGLIEKATNDSGAPFKPEVLKRLASLKKDDRATFESLRTQLRQCGCRVTALDDAIANESGDIGGRGPAQADILIELASSAELFHTPDKTGFADLEINGHRETWPIRSKGFRRWLTRRFFDATQGAANSEALQSALGVIEAKADFDGPERNVYVRVGGLDEKYYLDLCNERWQAVEIDACGWRIINNPPVRFRRAAGMKPLPVPQTGGSINDLRQFLNVKSEQDFVLLVAYLLAALRPRGPYPVIAVSGEQGSAKSTLIAILKALLDPNTASLRPLPREDRDLFIAATNGYVLAFDNVSGVSPWISDTLCRLSTGGSFAIRQLYTDQDEVLFDAVRPVMLNGIEDVVTKPDLADRAIFITLEPITEERRRPEQELWADFQLAHPRILGALLDAVAHGLAVLPQTRLEKLPRMADFALWVTACASALWPTGTFGTAYYGNRDQAVENVLESDLVAVALRAFIATRTEWAGTATELLGVLSGAIGEPQNRAKEWPKSAKALSGRLRRAATFLRTIGVEILFTLEGRARTRTIHIRVPSENIGNGPSASSAPSVNAMKSHGGKGCGPYPAQTVPDRSDVKSDHGVVDGDSTVPSNSLKSEEVSAADGTDASLPAKSGQKEIDVTGWKLRL